MFSFISWAPYDFNIVPFTNSPIAFMYVTISRKKKLRNCPILLIDCFCLRKPRLISAYRIWRFRSKLICCSNLFATRSFFPICYNEEYFSQLSRSLGTFLSETNAHWDAASTNGQPTGLGNLTPYSPHKRRAFGLGRGPVEPNPRHKYNWNSTPL